MRLSAPRSIDEVSRSLQIASGIIAAFGLVVILFLGYLNPLRFGKYFVVLGVIAFFVPGVLGVVAGEFLRTGRARWAWTMAVVSSVAQIIVAATGFIGQFFLSPLSALPLVACAAWLIASVYLLVQLIRWRFAVTTDVVGQHGFEIDPPEPR